jgi:lipopolysaccharide/colanic/teichoic acid biosynthesis glycosyltransferase
VMTLGNFKPSERGASLAELAVLLPVILLVMLGVVDAGRVVFAHQVLGDLSREAANLVSRGASVEESFAAASIGNGSIKVGDHGAMIVSTIRRRTPTDPTPWIFDQVVNGSMASVGSRVGVDGEAARIPSLDSLEPGVTVFAVELFHGFAPLFPVTKLGLNIYPEVVYEAAFF